MNTDRKEKFKEIINRLSASPEFLKIRALGVIEEKYQENLDLFFDAVENNMFTCINVARQIGTTTMLLAYALLDNKKTLYLTTKEDVVRDIKKRLTDKGFDIGNILFKYPSVDAFCSESPELVIVDNAAFINNMDILWASAIPTLLSITNDSKAILASIPTDNRTFFYKNYTSTKNSFNKICLKHIFTDGTIESIKRNYNNDETLIKNQLLNEFTFKEGRKSYTIPAVRVEEGLYKKILEKLEILKFERNQGVSISNYLRELIIRDLK